MPITKEIFVDIPEEEVKEKKPRKPRVRKEDRPFSPPHIGYYGDEVDEEGNPVFVPIELRPSRYKIAELVYDHYQKVENNNKYRDNWNRWLTDAKIKELQDLKENGRNTYPDHVHASSLASCSRKQVFNLLKFEKGLTKSVQYPNWNLTAVTGSLLHNELEHLLTYLGVSEQAEVQCLNEYFAGRSDHIISLIDLPRAVLDIKTLSHDQFEEQTHARKTKDYVAQVHSYAHSIGDIEVGIVLMVDRSKGRLFEFEFDIDPVYGQRMLDRAKAIWESAQKKRLPNAEKYINGKPSFECFSFCPYQQQCRQQEYDGSVQIELGSK